MQIELNYKGQTALVDTRGGELVSYRDADGIEYLWGGDEAYWPGRNPLLFPIVGGMPDNMVEVDGVAYPMQKHGFARWCEFTPIDLGENWCELELCSDIQTQTQYPFDFSLRVRQALINGGFSTTISVSNPGKVELPFCVGAHPAFRCPLREGERYEDYVLKFDECELPSDGLPILSGENRRGLAGEGVFVPEHGIFDQFDAVIFEELKSRGVSLVNGKTGHGLRVDFSDFPVLAFWSIPHKNAPFLCIEPWHGCPHAEGDSKEMKERRNCISLVPGGTRRFRYTVVKI